MASQSRIKKVDISEIVGKGYGAFWRCKKRYRVVKGGRGSKKSTTSALWYIFNMMKPEYKEANTLVIRKSFNTHRDSTYAQLKWAIRILQVQHLWECKLQPMELIYKPTGQKILFRGLDDPMSITSITVEVGVLCWCWFEEAYQIQNEDDFDKIDGSFRGIVPEGLFKQLTITFNPWNEMHFLKRKFFDVIDDDIFAITTNYLCNEYLDKSDIKRFDKMKLKNPKKYAVEGLGEWGTSEGLVFNNWTIAENLKDVVKLFDWHRVGVDWGWNDPTTAVCVAIDKNENILYIYDEYYQHEKTNNDLINEWQHMKKYKIIADSSEPARREDFIRAGYNMEKARKGQDSVRDGINKIRDFKVIIDANCYNTIKEFSSYANKFDEKTGKYLDEPIDDFNHVIDAVRYALEDWTYSETFTIYDI